MAGKRKKSRKRARPVGKKRRVLSRVNLFLRLLPFVLAAALLGLGVKAGHLLFFDSEYFNVNAVDIKGEKGYQGLSSVLSLMNSKKGVNIFSIDLRREESSICSRYPDLKNVRVKRVLPDTIEVSYEIRRPFCQVDSGDFYLVSDDMVVLTGPQRSADPLLPIITGIDISERRLLPNRYYHSPELKKAISLLKEIEESSFSERHKIVRVNMNDVNNPAVFIDDGTRIEIGEYSFKERHKLLEEILNDLKTKGRGAKVIDLRFEDAVVIPR